jgi:hypothetical protein
VRGALEPGVYSLSNEFMRPGLRLTDLGDASEILVAGGVPRQGALLAAKAHALRFTSERQVIGVSHMRPLPWAAAAAKRLYEMLALTPVEG